MNRNQTLLLNDECSSGSKTKSTTILYPPQKPSTTNPNTTIKTTTSTQHSVTTLKPTIIIKNDSGRKTEQPNVVIFNKDHENLHNQHQHKTDHHHHQSHHWKQESLSDIERDLLKQKSALKSTSSVATQQMGTSQQASQTMTTSNVTFNTNFNSSTSSFLSNGFIVQDEVHGDEYHVMHDF